MYWVLLFIGVLILSCLVILLRKRKNTLATWVRHSDGEWIHLTVVSSRFLNDRIYVNGERVTVFSDIRYYARGLSGRMIKTLVDAYH